MAGSNHFSIDTECESFKRSFRKLSKATPKGVLRKLLDEIEVQLEGLKKEPRPAASRPEPPTSKAPLPPLVEFRKLCFTIQKGASGQIRLMYIVDLDAQKISPVYIYSHEQYSKRPSVKEVTQAIKDGL